GAFRRRRDGGAAEFRGRLGAAPGGRGTARASWRGGAGLGADVSHPHAVPRGIHLACGAAEVSQVIATASVTPTPFSRGGRMATTGRALRLPGLVNRELLHIGSSLHFHACCLHCILHTTTEERIELGARLPEVDDSPALVDRAGRVEQQSLRYIARSPDVLVDLVERGLRNASQLNPNPNRHRTSLVSLTVCRPYSRCPSAPRRRRRRSECPGQESNLRRRP